MEEKQIFAAGDRVEQMCIKCGEERGHIVASISKKGRITRVSCPICGSRLFHLSEAGAEVMLGALDEVPSDLKPTREGWIIRREHWLEPLKGVGQFEGDPL